MFFTIIGGIFFLFPYFYPVLGALIGQQKGRKIEVMNSIELVFHVVEDVIIDMEYYNLKEGQCKSNLPFVHIKSESSRFFTKMRLDLDLFCQLQILMFF